MDIAWLWGLAAGALTTILGFLFAVLWDLAKEEKQKRALEDSVMNVLSAGLATVVESVKQNIHITTANIEALKKGQIQITALQKLPLEYWMLVVAQPPKKLVRARLLEVVADSTYRSHQLNCMVEARELFRTSSGGLNTYAVYLNSMDEEILNKSTVLLRQTEMLAKEINACR